MNKSEPQNTYASAGEAGLDREAQFKALCETLLSSPDAEALGELLDDLCTYKERDNMAQRLYAARLLAEGYTYQEVMERCDISSATLSRVSRCLQHGKGYRRFLTGS